MRTPTLVDSAEALAWIGYITNVKEQRASAKLTNSIDLAGTRYGGQVAAGASTSEARYQNALTWVPIGKYYGAAAPEIPENKGYIGHLHGSGQQYSQHESNGAGQQR